MRRDLVKLSAMLRDGGSSESDVKRALGAGNELSTQEIQQVVQLVYGSGKKVQPAALSESVYVTCLNPTSAAKSEESKKTAGLKCFDVGYRYAFVATSTMIGKAVNPEWDFAVPSRCRQDPQLKTGMTAGTKAADPGVK